MTQPLPPNDAAKRARPRAKAASPLRKLLADSEQRLKDSGVAATCKLQGQVFEYKVTHHRTTPIGGKRGVRASQVVKRAGREAEPFGGVVPQPGKPETLPTSKGDEAPR